MKKSFYITTTLPYVNADPHIGHAVEFIRADAIARFRKAQGDDVFFNTGTDEHGLKIYQNAEKAGQKPEVYIEPYVQKFKDLVTSLNLDASILHFTRTTDPHHVTAAQEFWRRCKKNGDIELKKHKIKYCVGCELEKSESELSNGHCILHPNLTLEIIDEENYFFNFKKYQKPLLELYKKNPQFVVPESRLGEIRSFVERGLEDFSISRLASKMPWGIPVPDDSKHVMYVWFDALVNYISALGWPEHEADFEKYWRDGTPLQYCGKDNLRQQAAIWQAMLMSVGFPTSHQIIVDGFVTGAGGVKMSKSLGNTINPLEIVEEYGADALRYFALAELHPFEDSPFTLEIFKTAYNAKLANGLGNLVSRIMKMATTHEIALSEVSLSNIDSRDGEKEYYDAFSRYEINKACEAIWEHMRLADKTIQEKKPFTLIKTNPEEAQKIIELLLLQLYKVGKMLEPIMPDTAENIKSLVKENKMPEAPLFPRKD